MPLPDPLAAARPSRFRVGLGAAIVLLVVGLGIAVLVSALVVGGNGRTVVREPEPPRSAEPGTSGAVIFVHILGEVNHPGLYQFRDGDRAIDAVAAAGGYTAKADKRQLNLARFLSDGEQIYVPAVGEATTPGAGAAPGEVAGKVNLNTADAATLESLPRVGPAMAQRIIEWRTANGRFSAIEDLMSVSGIGEKTFAELKDLVTI
ncbi:MAG TPA: helix-hairpin-helix domain-containing protein [Terrimesophilobacter sp.]|jgi:competence protein ComEA helix-hairpin-helix repeat region|uniref:helix-hairpin-helix domain-containing protein n=1 Tax=Terrimesophilobacter sp. TaxID=2906435 RepID=UPI002F92CE56